MVLGRGDYATASLRRQATSARVRLVAGGRTLQQPIDARDVVRAIDAALREDSGESAVLELGGPECLSHRELVARAARAIGAPTPGVSSIPRWAASAFAALAERTMSSPPLTPAMLGVLEHDDCIDPGPACSRLGLELTPLEETLARSFAASAREGDPA